MSHIHTHGHSNETKFQKYINYIIILLSSLLILFLLVFSSSDFLITKYINYSKDLNNDVEQVQSEFLIAEILEIEENEIEGYVVYLKTSEDKIVSAAISNLDLKLIENENLLFDEGDKMIVEQINFDGKAQYYIYDQYRLPFAIIAIVLFLLVAIIFAGLKGFSSFLGLIVSLIVLVSFIVPSIVSGSNPLFVSFVGSLIIAVLSLYLAHGFNKRTTLSLISTVISIFISIVAAYLFVEFTKLNGSGSEDAMIALAYLPENINLKGILLGGIIIGTLGVLDDITTAQTAVVEELHKANDKLSFKELYLRSISVGKEHIASLVNTLVLAYAGASFPLFILLVSVVTRPLWVTLNSEFLIEELIRTIVGSLTLILAVPISTLVATLAYKRLEKI